MVNNKRKKLLASMPGSERRVIYSLVAVLAAIAGFLTVMIAARLTADREAYVRPPVAQEVRSNGLNKLVKASPPGALPDIAFEDADGKSHNLSEWKGKIVLLNLWATWCAPCKEEMPSLDRLQAKLGGKDFAVVAINLDRNGADAPRKFLASNNISHLDLHMDKTSGVMQTLKAPGLPLTVLIDREGRQIARLAGSAEWDSSEAEALIREAMAAQGG